MKLSSWSYSRYNLYKQCPYKCKLIHIDKLKEPPSEAMARGVRIHELAENWIKGILPEKPFPEELRLFSTEIKKLRKKYKAGLARVEEEWALDIHWAPADWFSGWLRLKLDCLHPKKADTLVVTDWKTGRFRQEQNDAYIEQLELYALVVFIKFKEIKKVTTRLVYLDEGVIFPDPAGRKPVNKAFTRSQVPELKAKWEERIKPMLADETFAPRPNKFCNWCHFRKANGGPCQF